MNKKFTFASFTSASFLATFAFASNGFEKFITPQVKNVSKETSDSATAVKFTDFSK